MTEISFAGKFTHKIFLVHNEKSKEVIKMATKKKAPAKKKAAAKKPAKKKMSRCCK